MKLRAYQREAVDRVKAAVRRRPILVAPTGSGKTVMGVQLVEELDTPTLWLAHRVELIAQAAKHLQGYGLTTGTIIAGERPMPLAPVQVASVQTLVRRELPPAGLVVIDECHHATAETYRRILDGYPRAGIVGLTATPFRLDGKGLGDLFGELVVAAYTEDLIRAGYLVRPKVYASAGPDVGGVRVTAGDYNLRALAGRVDTGELVGDIVQTWLARAGGRRTVVFAVNVEHSRHIAERFGAAGVTAEHLDGTTGRDERAAILGRLASGQTRVVSNCMVLTEGWDLPALECAVIARPTASLNLHLQMIGRIVRSAAGKDGALVLDHAGNHHRHGLVTRRLRYSLDPGASAGASEPLGLRRCRECGLLFDTYAYACPECGWTPSAEAYRRELPETTAGELVEFDDEGHDYRAEYWARYAAFGRIARAWFKDRFGEWPVVGPDGELVDPANATAAQKQHVYAELVAVGEEKGFKSGWASHRYRDIFGVWPRGFVNEVRLRERFARLAGAGA